jgi:hypothetical protein
MPDLDSIKNQIVAEWRVIRDAPLTILAAFVFISLGAWRVVSWADGTTISGKDATIESLKTQIDSYKDKLGGASPDEAKARIDLLEKRLVSIEPRHLSEQQISDFTQVINSMPVGRYNLSIQSDMSCSDCTNFVAQSLPQRPLVNSTPYGDGGL